MYKISVLIDSESVKLAGSIFISKEVDRQTNRHADKAGNKEKFQELRWESSKNLDKNISTATLNYMYAFT